MKRVLMLCAIMFFTSVACEKPVIDDPVDDSSCVPFELTKSQSEFVECNNGNAFNLLKGLMDDAQCKNDDFVVSPLSAYILMGALANGADGQTRDQILDALGFNGGSISQINECCQYFMNGSDAVDAKTKIGIYNAVIVNRDYPLKPVFSQSMTSFYDAFVRNADFADKSTLDMINEWGKEKSGGLIPSVIEEINKNSILYALNCVSFKARWMSEFSMNSTKKESFTDINGNVKDVMMMNKEDISLYNDNGKWKTLCLTFGRGFYRMFILLPNESYGLATLVEELNSSSWNETVSSMKSKRVDIKLPKFETSTNITLNEVMQELGVVDAFDKEDANFTNMVDGYNVVVDFLNQSCRIKVDEEGVEAASITLGQLDGADMPDESGKLKFHADRPFVYMIQEISSGAIFFTGVKCK